MPTVSANEQILANRVFDEASNQKTLIIAVSHMVVKLHVFHRH